MNKVFLKTLFFIVVIFIFCVFSYMEYAVIDSFTNNGTNIDGYILKCEFKEEENSH